MTNYTRIRAIQERLAKVVLELDELLDAVERPAFNPTPLFELARTMAKKLSQTQVDSINAILSQMQDAPVQHVAYVLATAWHEARFSPQREWGRGKGRRYGVKGRHGQVPYGRGLVQITWDRNYEWLDRVASAAGLTKPGDVLRDFDLALRPDIAVLALVKGMLNGAFASNGKSLAHYGPDTSGRFDYVNARQTVNILDKAEQIAGYARRFETALKAGGWA